MNRRAPYVYILVTCTIAATTCVGGEHPPIEGTVQRVPGTESIAKVANGASVSPDGEWLVFGSLIPDSVRIKVGLGSRRSSWLLSVDLNTGATVKHDLLALPDGFLGETGLRGWGWVTYSFRTRGWSGSSFVIDLLDNKWIELYPTIPEVTVSRNPSDEMSCYGCVPLTVLTGLTKTHLNRPTHDGDERLYSAAWDDDQVGAFFYYVDAPYNTSRVLREPISPPGVAEVVVKEAKGLPWGQTSIAEIVVSPREKYLAYVVKRDGLDTVNVMNLRTGSIRTVRTHHLAGNLMWAPTEDVLYYTGMTRPNPDDGVFEVRLSN